MVVKLSHTAAETEFNCNIFSIDFSSESLNMEVLVAWLVNHYMTILPTISPEHKTTEFVGFYHVTGYLRT